MNKAIDVAQNHQLYLCLALHTHSGACQKYVNEWRHGGSFIHALISKLQRIESASLLSTHLAHHLIKVRRLLIHNSNVN